MKCYVCGTELRFLEYGQKIGKNGKPAKWPIYEKCPNITNHKTMVREQAAKAKPVDRPLPPPTPAITVPDGTPTTRELKTGMAFQWDYRKGFTKQEVLEVVAKYEKRTGRRPESARCNIAHYERFFAALPPDIDLKADLSFTPTWPRLDLDL
jgi:hypothetical protein